MIGRAACCDLFKALGLVLLVASAAPLSAQTDIHGTWTAELRQGKVFLQVRTTPPADWNRSGNGNGDWNMGQSFPIDELSGLPANDERLTAASVKFDLRREAGSLAMEGSFRDGRGAGLFKFAPRDAYVGEMREPRVHRRPPAVAPIPAGRPRRRSRSTSASSRPRASTS